MLITIFKENGKTSTIPMPLSALKSTTFWKLLSLDKDIDLETNKNIIIEIIDNLNEYKKNKGSFTLIEIHNQDDTGIKIII